MTAFGRLEVTLYGWKDVQIQLLLTNWTTKSLCCGMCYATNQRIKSCECESKLSLFLLIILWDHQLTCRPDDGKYQTTAGAEPVEVEVAGTGGGEGGGEPRRKILSIVSCRIITIIIVRIMSTLFGDEETHTHTRALTHTHTHTHTHARARLTQRCL